VDRITPAPSQTTLDDARRLTGCVDLGAVATEPFRQWVIEDHFTAGRPLWEAGGAQFVADVRPYEQMKLRMLNGVHSLLAYAGFLSGCVYVRDAMKKDCLRILARRHMDAAGATLPGLRGMDPERYRDDLLARFANPEIAHETRQIAMEGTEKLPQRIFSPATEALAKGGNVRPFAFATAAWMRYCLGKTEDGKPYPLQDPRAEEIRAVVADATQAGPVATALHRLPGLFPAALYENSRWRGCVVDILQNMLANGMAQTCALEAQRPDAPAH